MKASRGSSVTALSTVLLLAAACGGRAAPRSVPTATPPTATARTAQAEPRADTAPTTRSVRQLAQDAALTLTVEAIVDAFENHGPSLSPDGARVLFVSTRGRLPQLMLGLVSSPSASPATIAPSTERVASAVWSRDGAWALFRRDHGGDEQFHVFRARSDGSELVELASGDATQCDEPMLPRRKPDVVVFTARKQDTARTMLFVGSLKTGATQLAFADPGEGAGADVSSDGARALYVRTVSPSSQILFEVELATGRSVRIFPPEGKVATVTAARYSVDDARAFVATDDGADASFALAVDRGTRREVARYTVDRPTTAALESLSVSPRGDLLAVALDAGNHTQARLLDARSLTLLRDVPLAFGHHELGEFTADGAKLGVTSSLADRPRDIYLADATSGVLSPLREEARPDLSSLGSVDVTVTTVRAADGLALPVHFYLPRLRDPARPLPVAVFFHGGPMMSSSVRWNWLARTFTARGYAYVEPNIRGSTGFGRTFEQADDGAKREAALEDVETINRWLRAQSWADPARLGVLGASYGGYLALMALARHPTSWRVGGDAFGISDLVSLLRAGAPSKADPMRREFGDPDLDAAMLEQLSPMTHRDRITVPLFVYQGERDPRVPRAQSDRLVAALRARGGVVEYMVASDEGHSMARRANRVEATVRLLRFFDEHQLPDDRPAQGIERGGQDAARP